VTVINQSNDLNVRRYYIILPITLFKPFFRTFIQTITVGN
jgi:hypothetical protein